MSYTAYERETIINGNDEDRMWDVYTAQAVIMTKLRHAGVEPYWTETDSEGRVTAAKYTLAWRQISILNKTRKAVPNAGAHFRKKEYTNS